MRSETATALHALCGRPLVGHVLGAVGALDPRRLAVVIGPDDDDLAKELEATEAEVSRETAADEARATEILQEIGAAHEARDRARYDQAVETLKREAWDGPSARAFAVKLGWRF